mgnify:CR=1 FL=1
MTEVMTKRRKELIRKEIVDNWIWWEEDHDESEPLMWAMAEEIVKWRVIAQQLAIGAEDYLMEGYTAQLRQGWNMFLKEVTKNDQ